MTSTFLSVKNSYRFRIFSSPIPGESVHHLFLFLKVVFNYNKISINIDVYTQVETVRKLYCA